MGSTSTSQQLKSAYFSQNNLLRNQTKSTFLLFILLIISTLQGFGQVNFTGSYSQGFDGLPSTGSVNLVNNSTISGFYAQRTGTSTAAITITAGTGSSNSGGMWSYGSAALPADRAFGTIGSSNAAAGSFAYGFRLTNSTGASLNSITVSYTGEQWRAGGGATGINPQTAAFSYLTSNSAIPALDLSPSTSLPGGYTVVTALDYSSTINLTSTATLDGNLAANRTLITATITFPSPVPINGEIVLRWYDPDHTGSDHGLSIDDLSVTIPSPAINLSINDVTQIEGDAGMTNFVFTVSLAAPAGPGGVTFDITTNNNTATTADNDYVANSLTGQTIPMGGSTYSFTAVAKGDATIEPTESFFVDISNVVGATISDAQGLGTITNDDVAITPIHDIQGSGNTSPLVGQSVSTRGIVTGVKSNGFFLQEPEATIDADPNTSEGIFVFTSSAPPVAAAIGNKVQVTATVVEFVPSADPLQPPLTELSSPTVLQLSTGNPLPTPITLTTILPSPSGGFAQLEKYEGMRVTVSSLTVVAPTEGFKSEANATSTSTGVFYGVVTGNARPYRETGVIDPNPVPSGSIPPIPRYDGNPELIRVDSDSQTGTTAIDVSVDAIVSNITGPLDYSTRYYTILPDLATPPSITGGVSATPLPDKLPTQFTVASYNLERFFDTVNDPAVGEVVLTSTAYANRKNKASLAIRNILKMPDILAVVEMENLTTLQDLSAKISADAIAASQTDPQYQAYLVEGNDVGGIDVGFLVKTGITVNEVVQELKNTHLFSPTMVDDGLLNDRPPLRLSATVNHPSGKSVTVTVIVNHLRSLLNLEATTPGSNGWTTDGERVRGKRQKQAEDLANLIQTRQTNDPNEKIIVLGDFNAFQFNDGFVDMINVIKGTPTPDNETVVPGDGIDLVTPDLISPTITGNPYSYTFNGTAQIIDHVMISGNLSNNFAKLEYPRIDADFPEILRSDPNRPEKISDHDPALATFNFCPPSNTFIATGVTVSSTAICSGASIESSNLSLSATCATGIVTWYNQMTGGVALGTGSPFTQNPTANTTYYAECVDFICVSDRVATSEVVVNTTPTDPTGTSNSTICNNTNASLSATCASGTVNWYDSNTNLQATGSPFITFNLTTNTTYKVRCEDGGCFSAFVDVLVTITLPKKIFVNIANTSGTYNGTSWATAFQNLQDALSTACNSDTIWVANGTYIPSTDPTGNPSPTDPRDKTFNLINGVKIFGGFIGTENQLIERIAPPSSAGGATILSGDIGTANDASDNAYHVVTSVNDDNTTVLDGFTIKNGNANDATNSTFDIESQAISRIWGGGIVNYFSSPILSNLIFEENAAGLSNAGGGAGMANFYASPSISNVVFSANTSNWKGGAIFSSYGSSPIKNAVFSGNTATKGGGIYAEYSSININNVTFWANTATNLGGAIANYSDGPDYTASIINTIFWGNSASASATAVSADIENQGGGQIFVSNTALQLAYNATNYPASFTDIETSNNIFAKDPLFVASATPAGGDAKWRTTDDGLTLLPCSPAIDAGTNDGVLPKDILNNTRPFAANITDMGSYEFQGNPVIAPTEISNPTICNNTTTSLSATCSSGTVYWYPDAEGTGEGRDGSPLVTGVLTNNTSSPIIKSYWVRCESGGSPNCNSPMMQVDVTINPSPTDPTDTANPSICNNTTTSLSATCAIGTVNWYDAGGTALQGTGSPFTTPNLTENTTYKVRCESGGIPNCPSAFVDVIVTVNPVVPEPTGTANTSVCSGTTTSLSATCSEGTVNWYDANGTALLFTGSPFETPILTTNTSYKVRCESTCNSTFVAVSVTVNPNPIVQAFGTPNPVCAEQAVTLTPICQLFNISATLIGSSQVPPVATAGTGTVIGTLNLASNVLDLKINFANLSSNAMAGHIHQGVVGVNGGVLVGFSGVPNATSGEINYNAVVNPMTLIAEIFAGNTYVNIHTENNGSGEIRGQLSATCVANSYVWNPGNLSGETVIVNPSTTTVYTVTANNTSTGCSATATTTINVNPKPTAPTITPPSALSVCSPSTLTLTATCATGTVTWSDNNTGTSLTLSAVGTYSITATCTSLDCVSDVSAAVLLEIKALPNAQASNTGPYSFGQTINLSASGGIEYAWSGPNSFSSTIANPSIFNAQIPKAGIYSVTVTNVGCSATATTEVFVSGIDPCVQILAYDYVLAGNPSQTLFSMTNGQNIAQRPTATSIIVRPICNTVTIGSVDMTITGPSLNWTVLQNVEPFALFDNSGPSINGQVLAPGTYSLTVTGYFGDNRTGGTTYGPVVTTFTILGNAPTISMPTFAGTEFCAGTNVNVSFTTTGTFAGGNLFQVLLSDAIGNFNSPQIIGTTTAAGSVLCNIPALTIGGDNYRIKVISTDPAAAGNYNLVPLKIHPIVLNLVSPTNDYPFGAATKKAIETINARNNITGLSIIQYKAGNAINLNPGFQVVSSNGSSFKAQIEGCNN